MPSMIQTEFKQFHEGKEKRTLTHHVPTLFIGVGGTGKDAVMRLRKRFYDSGREIGEFCRYLVIDTDVERWWPGGSASEEEYLPVKPSANEMVPCPISQQQFQHVFESMERARDPLYTGWLKPEMRNYGYRAVIRGAGTHRQFGRMAFMLNREAIRTAIQTHLLALTTEAHAVGRAVGQERNVEQGTVEVVIVTSLAGGTGSGMFLDVAYMVKDVLADTPRLQALPSRYTSLICVMPSAFESRVPTAMFNKFQQNAYGALMELEHYGTPRTDDGLFAGRSERTDDRTTRTGFIAPWKLSNDNFIEGAGWESCYLIDNCTTLSRQNPLELDATCQMIADYLFLDFDSSGLAVQKRSNRCNLSQYQEDYLETRIEKREETRSHAQENYTETDVVYKSKRGCTFSSFGLAEIEFDRDAVYRAASYRLAWNLIESRWLGRPESWPDSKYNEEVKRDLYSPIPSEQQSEPPSFHPDYLTRLLYQTQHGNWFDNLEAELKKLDNVHYKDGTVELRKVLDRHQKHLARSATGAGAAQVTLLERQQLLSGTPGELGELRRRMQLAALGRCDQHGVKVAAKLLPKYRAAMVEIAKMAQESADGPKSSERNALSRLEEADQVYLFGRNIAQRIEYPRAKEEVKSTVRGLYKTAVAPTIRSLAQRISEYIGDGKAIPAELERHRTLHEFCDRSTDLLKRVSSRLDDRFKEMIRYEGTPRTQSLLPTGWDGAKYDDQIGRALIGYPEVGKQAGTSAFDWDRLHAQVLRLVKTEGPQELRGVSTLTQLIDRWFQLSATSDEEVKKIAETIAAACRKVLHAAQLNLADFFDGSVIDLMMVNLNSAERNSKIQNILKFSAPYLPLDLQNQATMTANYRPVADNLMGKKRGESPRSAANEAALDQLIESELQRLSGMRDGEINRTDGSPSSLVLCREVWGVPLQYYLDLNRLYAVYQNSGRDRNESHINFRESEEELPDIRAIDPRVYEKIRDGIEYVLYAMMRSTVTCRDGSYIVKVPDRFGNMNTFAVGSRVSRIIKRCCESDAIREHLRRDQEEWERSATPKQWAALFASAWATYQDTSHLIRDQAAGVSPPLRNCFQLLLDRIIAHLNETQEGRQWFDALRVRTRENKDSTESIQAYEKLFAELKSRKVLFRAIAHVPIYEINWDALDEIRLPNDAATGGRAAAGGGADAAGTGTPAP